jgi:hypothetical protein
VNAVGRSVRAICCELFIILFQAVFFVRCICRFTLGGVDLADGILAQASIAVATAMAE